MKQIDLQRAKNSLQHVLWIGGASSGGKTTVSTRLADEFGFLRYDGDAHLHMAEATKNDAPTMYAIRERWVAKNKPHLAWTLPPEEQAAQFRAGYPEDFRLAVDDLLGMDAQRSIVVDLFGGYPIPELVEIAGPRRLIFLVATPEFQRNDYLQTFEREGTRDKLVPHYPDPELLMANYVECHVMLSQYVREECERQSLPILITGGNMRVEEVYVAVCKHFRLAPRSKAP